MWKSTVETFMHAKLQSSNVTYRYHLRAEWIALNWITFLLTMWKVAGATVTFKGYGQAGNTDVPARGWQWTEESGEEGENGFS